MFAARTLARSAPRAVSRMATAAIAKPSNTLLRMPIRSQISAFSTSLLRKSATGSVNAELSAKLASEVEFENDINENDGVSPSIKDFLDNGPFEIRDIPGEQDVALTRTYGNEKITVTFSISDLTNMENDLSEEDYALGDEDVDGNGRSAQEGEDADDVNLPEVSVTCRLNIVVEKPNQGCLNIEAVAQDANIIVENLYYYKDPAIAHSSSPEAAHKERDVYPGPPFGTLDEDLQLLMEQYLEERGINTVLAAFVPDYMDMKEHREYLEWLKNVKSFVEA